MKTNLIIGKSYKFYCLKTNDYKYAKTMDFLDFKDDRAYQFQIMKITDVEIEVKLEEVSNNQGNIYKIDKRDLVNFDIEIVEPWKKSNESTIKTFTQFVNESKSTDL